MKLAIILGSTREGRASDRLAKWVLNTAEQLPDADVELLDLRDYTMPFFDEPLSPRSNPDRHPKPEVKKWLDKLAEKDAFVIVSPEYNHNIPAVLKNALDYIDLQIHKKPFGFVTHGSTGGARATSALKIIVSEGKAMAISSNVAINQRVKEIFDENGVLDLKLAAEENGPNAKLKAMLDELKWYSDALATARNKQ